jgi:outer membrane biosynthesis protein TonB
MIDLSRKNDRISLVTTIGIITVVMLILLFTKCTSVVAIENPNAGGIPVSLGEPDFGGPDNSAAEQEEYVEPVEEEYVPEHQETSDVEEAPEVVETKPTKKPPTETKTPTKPTETKKPPRKPNEKDMFGKKPKGGGSGTGSTAGQEGEKDGDENGRPDGTGGNGGGTSTGIGKGIDKIGFGGFRVTSTAQPRAGSQKEGKVVLDACIDASGRVTSISRSTYIVNGITNDPDLTARAKEALRKFRFQKTGSNSTSCGTVVFTFKVN